MANDALCVRITKYSIQRSHSSACSNCTCSILSTEQRAVGEAIIAPAAAFAGKKQPALQRRVYHVIVVWMAPDLRKAVSVAVEWLAE